MTASTNSIRALLVYALVLPLALVIGYQLANPTEFGTWATLITVILILCTPLVLAHHHPFLFLSWNMSATVFFLPGRPQLWLVMTALSLSIAVLQRALSKESRFISAPSVVWPLLYLAAVVYITAKLTGGFGLRILGSENVGGKRYILVFAGIAGFLAMIAHPVPAEKAQRYAGLFFLGSITDSLGSALPFIGPQFYFLFLIFPIENVGPLLSGFGDEINRFWGLSMASLGVVFYLLARHGVRGTLTFKKPMRTIIFLAVAALTGAGGFRSLYILMGLTFLILFYFEGLLRSRYAITLFSGIVVASALLVPFAYKLPLSIQRTLSFLPLNIDPIARYDAQASTDWRVQMWQVILPEVPKHLWLGKGLGISGGELELTGDLVRRGQATSQQVAMMAGDYHSGPLSVVIQFGIWGVIGMVWFLAAGVRALYFNYRYGDENLKKINTFLLAHFVARIIHFIFVFGGFHGDVAIFAGIVGFSLSLNNGIRKQALVRADAKQTTKEFGPVLGPTAGFAQSG